MDVSLSELQELVMDREAWRAAIHGVSKIRTLLSDWTELNWLREGNVSRESEEVYLGKQYFCKTWKVEKNEPDQSPREIRQKRKFREIQVIQFVWDIKYVGETNGQ